MKSGFKDPTAPKNQHPKDHPMDGKKTPWNFTCPQYDQRSSCFVDAGTHYGVGHAQPIGSTKHNAKSVIPVGRPHTMEVDEKG